MKKNIEIDNKFDDFKQLNDNKSASQNTSNQEFNINDYQHNDSYYFSKSIIELYGNYTVFQITVDEFAHIVNKSMMTGGVAIIGELLPRPPKICVAVLYGVYGATLAFNEGNLTITLDPSKMKDPVFVLPVSLKIHLDQ